MRDTVKNIIEQEVIKNLLSAHKRIAETGNVKEIICLSKYLLKLAEKFNNIVIEVPAEDVEDKEKCPPNYSG